MDRRSSYQYLLCTSVFVLVDVYAIMRISDLLASRGVDSCDAAAIVIDIAYICLGNIVIEDVKAFKP